MAMVNMNNLLNGKDSRWLQLEVCREFQRNKCTRPDTECKFAHPPANVEVQNGRVTACYDSIKGRCNREKPPCKYFHPPQHLKDQLLINGRNHLALKNALMQQMGLTAPGQPIIPGQVTVVGGKLPYATPLTLGQPLMQSQQPLWSPNTSDHLTEGATYNPADHYSTESGCLFSLATSPYLTGMPQVGSTFSPYFTPGPVMPAILGPDPASVGSPLSVVPQTVVAQQKMPRSDRLEMDMKTVGSFYYENFGFPGMVPYKRPAADKSGMPVYQPNTTTYQQLMQLQQPFVPVSCEYSSTPTATVTSASLSPNDSPTASSSGVAEAPKPEEVDKGPPAGGIPALPQQPDPSGNSAAVAAAAAAAKEVAQQNYAKAVKMAASGISPVMALNYTGVALNKQTVTMMPPPPPRFAPPPPTAVPGLGLAAQVAYSQHQHGLFAFNRAPSPHTMMPQYQFLRPQLVPSPYAAMVPQAASPVVSNGIFNHMMAQYNPLTTVAANNNNVITTMSLQPYKKMKTT